MSKKGIDRKAIQQFTIEARENGKTDQDIYNELSQEYYNKKGLTLMITGTATTENMNQYRIYNHILLGLLAIGVLFKVFFVFSLSIQTGEPTVLVLLFIVPIMNLWFMYEIARYNAFIYRFCAIIAIINAMRFMTETDDSMIVVINLALGAAIAGLAYYIDNKLFPKYSPYNLKQDSNGEYILS